MSTRILPAAIGVACSAPVAVWTLSLLAISPAAAMQNLHDMYGVVIAVQLLGVIAWAPRFSNRLTLPTTFEESLLLLCPAWPLLALAVAAGAIELPEVAVAEIALLAFAIALARASDMLQGIRLPLATSLPTLLQGLVLVAIGLIYRGLPV